MTLAGGDIADRLNAVAIRVAKELAPAVDMTPARRAWRLVQRLKMLPGAIDAITADESLLRGAAQSFATAAGAAHLADELWPSMLLAWHKTTRSPGPLGAAFQQAIDHPITLLGAAATVNALFVGVMSLAYHLQRAQGSAPMWLPQREIADLYDVHQTTVSTLLELGRTRFKLLIRVRKGRFGKQGRAAMYRFNFAARDVYVPPAPEAANRADVEPPRAAAARVRPLRGKRASTLNGSGARRRRAVDTPQPDERTRS